MAVRTPWKVTPRRSSGELERRGGPQPGPAGFGGRRRGLRGDLRAPSPWRAHPQPAHAGLSRGGRGRPPAHLCRGLSPAGGEGAARSHQGLAVCDGPQPMLERAARPARAAARGGAREDRVAARRGGEPQRPARAARRHRATSRGTACGARARGDRGTRPFRDRGGAGLPARQGARARLPGAHHARRLARGPSHALSRGSRGDRGRSRPRAEARVPESPPGCVPRLQGVPR